MSEEKKVECQLRFDGSADDANAWAAELEQEVKGLGIEGVSIRRAKTTDRTMDLGSTLVLVLSAPAVLILARTIRDFAKRTNASRVSLITKDGVLVAENLESKDVPSAVAAFNQLQK